MYWINRAIVPVFIPGNIGVQSLEESNQARSIEGKDDRSNDTHTGHAKTQAG